MSETGSKASAELHIKGKVQGVFYRASAKTAATELGLNGWVRNEADGSVRALAQGPKEQVEAFIEWCHRGPPAARVEAVHVEWLDADAGPTLTSFEIRR